MIDPLDGTTNFIHEYPHSCVSIGLTLNKKAIVGVVYNPFRDEMFTASKGNGARLNGSPIHVSKAARLEDALCATGFPKYREFLNFALAVTHRLVGLFCAT